MNPNSQIYLLLKWGDMGEEIKTALENAERRKEFKRWLKESPPFLSPMYLAYSKGDVELAKLLLHWGFEDESRLLGFLETHVCCFLSLMFKTTDKGKTDRLGMIEWLAERALLSGERTMTDIIVEAGVNDACIERLELLIKKFNVEFSQPQLLKLLIGSCGGAMTTVTQFGWVNAELDPNFEHDPTQLDRLLRAALYSGNEWSLRSVCDCRLREALVKDIKKYPSKTAETLLFWLPSMSWMRGGEKNKTLTPAQKYVLDALMPEN